MDDYFSDDDLDALNPNALQELENTAIQLTQAAQKRYEQPSQAYQAYEAYDETYDDFEDDDLDDAVVQEELKANVPVNNAVNNATNTATNITTTTVNTVAVNAANRTTGTSAGTNAGSRVVPQQVKSWGQPPISRAPSQPVATSASASRPPIPRQPQPQYQRQQQQQQHYQQQQYQHQQRPQQQRVHPTITQQPPPPPFSQRRPNQPPPPLQRPHPPVSSIYQASQQPPRPTGPTSHELAALQAQILDLQTRLNTKDGEIQIVRSRLDKARNDHDREVQALRKRTSEQIAKYETAIEAAKAAERTTTTELEFTRRDLREELDRAKRRDAPATPRKNATAKAYGLADGFEDVEMAASPTKGQRGRNAGAIASSIAEPTGRVTRTPTKGGKRKRQAVDSPINALETHSEDAMVIDDGPAPRTDSIAEGQGPIAISGHSFDYLRTILNHSAAHGRSLVFDYLAGFTLPSRPSESLASILFQKLAVIDSPDDPMRLPIEFCEQVIQLWEACRKESILEPITELVSLIIITLQLYSSAVAPYIAPSLISIAMESCYDVGIPRFNNHNPGDPTDESWIKLSRNIPTAQILSLLYMTALGCAASPPVAGGVTAPISDFWSEVHVQFVLMLLSPKHPIEDYIVMLRLLCTSVFPQSIGPTPPGQTADFAAVHIIQSVSLQLVDTPRWDIDRVTLHGLRIEILKTLVAFARSDFGLLQMATGDYVVPRLVTLICACIEELYDGTMQYTPTATPAGRHRLSTKTPTPASPTTAASAFQPDLLNSHLSSLITHAMLLLHTLVRSPATRDVVDLPAKLARVLGGPQKYLLGLARLNFADTDDGGVVSEETAELAHELLELAVTEDEGTELGVYFGGLA